MSKISVLMSVYNEEENILRQAIDSILNQQFIDFEFVIIIDNPSRTDLVEVIRNYTCKDSRVFFHINDQNMGLVKSLNRGIDYCKADVVARMDADDISLPNRLEEQYELLTNENLDIVGADTNIMDGDLETTEIVEYPHTITACRKRLKLFPCCAHPTWMVRKAVYTTLQGYRNIKYCEDFDFLIRASLAGYKISNVPKVLLKYRIRDTGISKANYFPQKACSTFLSAGYRKRKPVSEEEYIHYTESEQFKKDCRNMEDGYRTVQMLKTMGQGEGKNLIKLLRNPYYLRFLLLSRTAS
jgi:glycosyltransferase involved in cell wall biosynthesis